MKKFLTILCLVVYNTNFSQNIKLKLVHDFEQKKIVNTFSFDLNRTDEVKEKNDGKYFNVFEKFYKNKYDLFIRPVIDVNLGDGISSSENNILSAIEFSLIKLDKGKANPNKSNIDTRKHKGMYLSGNYESDKFFEEKLGFTEIKYLYNPVHTFFKDDGTIKRVLSYSFGPFMNIGYRFSNLYNNKFYNIAGLKLDFSYRFISDGEENFKIKTSSNYSRIISDLEEITTDDYTGFVKTTLSKKIKSFKNGNEAIAIELEHKYGNKNLYYQYIHTLGLSIKYEY